MLPLLHLALTPLSQSCPRPLPMPWPSVAKLPPPSSCPGPLSQSCRPSFSAPGPPNLYDFELYTHPVPVDAPCVVLASGKSTILKEAVSLSLPMCPRQAVPIEPEMARLLSARQAGEAAAVRAYVAAVAAGEYKMTEAAQGRLVDDFVKARADDPTYGAELFQVSAAHERVWSPLFTPRRAPTGNEGRVCLHRSSPSAAACLSASELTKCCC
eukprot:194634-Chlamydomonas_euryale.AAC.1